MMGERDYSTLTKVKTETKEEPEATVSLKIPHLLASWCSALEINPVQGQLRHPAPLATLKTG